MQTYVLQDWVSINGAAGGNPVIQTEQGWLDLSPFQDLVAWIDMPQATGSPSNPTLFLETSPSKDDVLFVSMNGATGYPLSTAAMPTVASLLLGVANTPLATFLRWRIVGPTGAWNASFRITISVNSPGWLVPDATSPGTFKLPLSSPAALGMK